MAKSDEIRNWLELADEDWRSLFLGNGVSINICSGFGYSKLYDQACLSPAAQKLFADYETTNFELILERLADTAKVMRTFAFPVAQEKQIQHEYEGIRQALFDAVGATHISHAEIPETTLERISLTLLGFGKIFTTNYDLLPYWSLMASGKFGRFTDFFRRGGGGDLTFDLATSVWWRNRTRLLHLHGGLHLWRDDRTGATGKWEAPSPGLSLLEVAGRYDAYPQRQPLLVSEGTAADKLGVIRGSAYLSFALGELARDSGPLVVLGSSFGLSDAHIVDAIKAGPRRRIAVALFTRGATPQQLRLRMAELDERFDGHDVAFFDVATHPLGDGALRVR